MTYLCLQYLIYCENEVDFVSWVKCIASTMKDFQELDELSMELQGATVRANASAGAGTVRVTYSLLGGR